MVVEHSPMMQLAGNRCPCERCEADRKRAAEPPNEIWLQLDVESADVDDCTWCRDKINDTDVRYVRADIAGAPIHPSTVNNNSPCAPDGLMFDAFGNQRRLAKRITFEGVHLICRPEEVDAYLDSEEDRSSFEITDVYLSAAEIDSLPEFNGW